MFFNSEQVQLLRPSKIIIRDAPFKTFFSSFSHQQPHKSNRFGKLVYRLTFASFATGVVYDAFHEFHVIGGINRFARSLKVAVTNSIDYSYNLYGLSEESQDYDEVNILEFKSCWTKMTWPNLQILKKIHLRCAHRILNGCMKNGGLYIKIGQGVSAINHILPKEYTDTLKKLEVLNFTMR